MTEGIASPAKVLSEESASKAAALHQVYMYLLQLAARKKAADRAQAGNGTRVANERVTIGKPLAQSAA